VVSLFCVKDIYIYKGSLIFNYISDIAILMNVRDVVRLSSSWDDEQQDMGELNKLLVPVLIKALDYDIQEAANNTISAVQSGVSCN
jgi:hypothetical protein